MRKQFFRWATIERATNEYRAHLKTTAIWNGMCRQALDWKYGRERVFHARGGFFRLIGKSNPAV